MRPALLALLLLPSAAFAQKFTLVNRGPGTAAHECVAFNTEKFKIDGNAAVIDGKTYPVQKVAGGYLAVSIPRVEADSSVVIEFKTVKWDDPPQEFKFEEKKGEHVDVLFGKRPVLRYVNKPHDDKDHYLTFKPFHQVFDPQEGKTLLSSGANPNTKDFLYPHHRGLFFGFNNISYEQDGKKMTADIWHGEKKVGDTTETYFSTADKTVNGEAGPLYAEHISVISWHGSDGKTFAEETRRVFIQHVDGGTLLVWDTELTTKLDKVRLDGDPQHAGFHFRATQDVAKAIEDEKALAKKENRQPKPATTYYLRPDGKGKEGETRNWDKDEKKRDAKTTDLPWEAMCFETGGKRYTVLRIPSPHNPKETRGSERDYGRFGDYFEFDLTPKTPLKLRYRIWVQEGEMTLKECDKMADCWGHLEPPEGR